MNVIIGSNDSPQHLLQTPSRELLRLLINLVGINLRHAVCDDKLQRNNGYFKVEKMAGN